MEKKKIGILGGTFNPIHIGHLILGQTALEQFQLDQVLFMPSKNPPHKQQEHILDEQIRAKMIQLAIADNPAFALSTFEMEREGMTYTADTLTQLTKRYPEEEYYFIIGADSLFYIDQWKEPEVIFSHCKLVAAIRDHKTIEQMQAQIRFLTDRFQGSIALLNAPNIDISSSDIRKRSQEGKNIQYYVMPKVAAYIKDNNIYR
ncbi:nicotinate-nucleotide adenylyltransferase [Anaerosporobacter faecicola]|uniref:nicotinate-nucleotide adenylyltransferase n=1 Tax=Anaerosporobacter faecicola TaxID=2718714 RepID=UPI00143C126D|nr:nicotinate-nucleotide adenylyltransferase [Anaerosporobacter faecicola]